MLSALRQPKWIFATVFVIVLACLFIYLGFWQLDRHRSRIAANEVAAAQLSAPPVPLEQILADPEDSIEYRRVTVVGDWRVDQEVLIRSQVHLGQAGFHVITPYVFDGAAVLINRGWVPLTMDTTPVDPAPEHGQVQGWIQSSQERGWLGPEDGPGDLTVFSRVDIDRIQQQVSGDLVNFYLVLDVPDEGQLPAPIDLPELDDNGPHLAYAIQWFGFAAVGLVGFFFLARKRAGHGRKSSSATPSLES